MKLGDQPVHPTPWEDDTKPNGITLRQEFAKAALEGLIANEKIMEGMALAGGKDLSLIARGIALMAVAHSDALLTELEKPHE